MKKLLIVLSLLTPSLYAEQFYGHQSLNGLGNTSLLTAFMSPESIFIYGTLSLPQPSGNGNTGTSAVVVEVSKNGATLLYQGAAGANGFSIPQLTIVTPDSVTVNLSSSAAIDQGLNVIKGDVFYGTF